MLSFGTFIRIARRRGKAIGKSAFHGKCANRIRPVGSLDVEYDEQYAVPWGTGRGGRQTAVTSSRSTPRICDTGSGKESSSQGDTKVPTFPVAGIYKNTDLSVGDDYSPCGLCHLVGDGRIGSYRRRQSRLEQANGGGPPGGTRSGAAGGERDGEMDDTKNGATAIEAIVPCHMWWTKRGSNPRPPACKAVALATELLARIDIYNIPAWRRERNRKIQPPSYLRNSSDWAKQAGDYPLPVPLPAASPRPS